jgi:hypothetical protein
METTTRPACPYPCAGSGCPYVRVDVECITCESRPTLDAHYRALMAWYEEEDRRAGRQVPDLTGASHPYFSPALAGWGGGDR